MWLDLLYPHLFQNNFQKLSNLTSVIECFQVIFLIPWLILWGRIGEKKKKIAFKKKYFAYPNANLLLSKLILLKPGQSFFFLKSGLTSIIQNNLLQKIRGELIDIFSICYKTSTYCEVNYMYNWNYGIKIIILEPKLRHQYPE